MAEDELCASLRRIADTVETNGGWHIAALKVRAGAEEIERLREDYRNCDEQRSLASDMCDALIAERDKLRAALERIAQSGAEHPWGGPAAFARMTLAADET